MQNNNFEKDNITEADKNVCLNCQESLKILEQKAKTCHLNMELLSSPQKIFEYNIPVKMDSGKMKIFKGFRVQYNNALGPTKGGIRFHQKVNLEEVKILAFLMALKCALAGLPFGGAKGAVIVNPDKLSLTELERLSRGFMRMAHNSIGPQIDIPAPDVGTNEQIMGWMADEYGKIKGRFEPAVITGKPIEMGGSAGRKEATAFGGAFALKRLMENKGKSLKNLRIVVQGFGNVGSNIASILEHWGCKIIAVSDCHTGIFNEEGLNIENILKKQKKKGILPKIDNVKKTTNKDLLELECDVLIPAAAAEQITKKNGKNIKAKIILEMANGPTTREADEILRGKEVEIIPDILANSGGVIVSYFEWLQNLKNEKWTKEKVFAGLKEKMEKAFDSVYANCQTEQCDLRLTSHLIAIRKILTAEAKRH